MNKSTYSIKKLKLLRLVIILSLVYASGLAIVDIFGITSHIEYRAPLMLFYSICNLILLYMISKSDDHNLMILNTVLILALLVFSITMVIYPPSEIRIMWYFFTIMIAYYVGGRKTGHITAFSSVILLFTLDKLFNLNFTGLTNVNIIIGVLFISQLSNYFVSILDENEKQLYNYQQDLEDKISRIKNLLDNAGQGFLYFNKDMQIGSEYSKEAKKIFKKDISGLDITELLYEDDAEKRKFFKFTLQGILVEDEIKQEILISLLQKEFEINRKYVEVEYKILNKENFMMIVTDVTSKKRLAQKVKKEQQILKMVIETVTTKEQFLEVKKDYEFFIDKVNEFKSLEKLSDLRKEIHTYKGLFAQKEMYHVVQRLHDFESIIDKSLKSDKVADEIISISTDQMYSWLEEDLDIIKGVLGDDYFSKTEYIEIGKFRLHKIEEKIAKYVQTADESLLKAIKKEIKELQYKNVIIFFKPYEKLVEQLAEQLEKNINSLKLECDNIYIPEKYIPFINSLVHIFRNSVDHGIETLEERCETQKDEFGTITCKVKQIEDQFSVQITDDGKGIDIEKIKTLAVNKGIYSQSEVDVMSDDEAIMIIFKDAFTTNKTVTSISGRGVGLASIVSELEKLDGKMSIENKFGKGITFSFKMPFSY